MPGALVLYNVTAMSKFPIREKAQEGKSSTRVRTNIVNSDPQLSWLACMHVFLLSKSVSVFLNRMLKDGKMPQNEEG